MSKRGNELSQLSKEDYEARMEGGSNFSASDKFSKASAEELSRRRILRTGRCVIDCLL